MLNDLFSEFIVIFPFRAGEYALLSTSRGLLYDFYEIIRLLASCNS